MLVLIKGAGDLATGTAVRLHRAGFRVVMTDIARPTAVRRTVAFCQCMYDGTAQVEGIAARRVETAEEAAACLTAGEVPVLADPEARIRTELPFDALVDAILAKRNLGTALTDAPIVLALGPGFTAGVDCHGVVETKRGHYLGRLILAGSAIPNTGVPGIIKGYGTERLLRAPTDGYLLPVRKIGDEVSVGEVVGYVGGVEVCARVDGVLRGLIHPRVRVTNGLKIGDVDPRGDPSHCWSITDKALAIAGGVLEVIMSRDSNGK